MLIIVISYGREGREPFTQTCICEDEWIDPLNTVDLLSFVYKELQALPSTLDKVIVIQNDQITIEYDNEDGLGTEDQDMQLEIIL